MSREKQARGEDLPDLHIGAYWPDASDKVNYQPWPVGARKAWMRTQVWPLKGSSAVAQTYNAEMVVVRWFEFDEPMRRDLVAKVERQMVVETTIQMHRDRTHTPLPLRVRWYTWTVTSVDLERQRALGESEAFAGHWEEVVS